jgi:hypothetical protein
LKNIPKGNKKIKSTLKQKTLAVYFGVDCETVGKICRGATWKHIKINAYE